MLMVGAAMQRFLGQECIDSKLETVFASSDASLLTMGATTSRSSTN
jgi:hypothetical protein